MAKWRQWTGAAALALAVGAAHAAGTASVSEERWIEAARTAVAFGQQQGLPITLRVEEGDDLPGHTPVGIQSEHGQCFLVVSVRGNPTAERLASLVEPELVDLFLAGAAMHEVGHCYRRLQGYPHNEKLLPFAEKIGFVRDWFNRRVRTEEAFADMTESVWLARYHPDRYDAMMRAIQEIRESFLEPKHDTLAWLAHARAQGVRDGGGNIFEAAEQRLHAVR